MTKFSKDYQPSAHGRKTLGENKKVSLQVYVRQRTKDFFLAHKGIANSILENYVDNAEEK